MQGIAGIRYRASTGGGDEHWGIDAMSDRSVEQFETVSQVPNDSPCLRMLAEVGEACKVGLALCDGALVGGVKTAVCESTRDPEKVCQSLVAAAGAGTVFGVLAACPHPLARIGLAAVGGATGLLCARDLAARASSDFSLREAISRAASAKTVVDFLRTLPAVEDAAGKYSWELAQGAVGGGLGFRGGRLLGNGIGSLCEQAAVRPVLALATGEGHGPRAFCPDKAQAGWQPVADKQSGVLFSKKFAHDDGGFVEVHENGNATYTKPTGATEHLKYKPVSHGLKLVYKPEPDTGKMLKSIRMLDEEGQFEPFYFLEELFQSKGATKLISKLEGKWEPESSTHRMIELRSAAGEVINIKHAYERPACPFLVQRLGAERVGSYEIERLPFFTRRAKSWTEIQPLVKTMEQAGWYSTDAHPENVGRLPNGFNVLINPDPRCFISYWDAPGWSNINHGKAAALYENAIARLGEIYGKNHPVMSSFKITLADHYDALRNGKAIALYEALLGELQEQNRLQDAAAVAGKLFYIHRALSKYGTVQHHLAKALKYSALSDELLTKHYAQGGE
jgi:hypothetical protein